MFVYRHFCTVRYRYLIWEWLTESLGGDAQHIRFGVHQTIYIIRAGTLSILVRCIAQWERFRELEQTEGMLYLLDNYITIILKLFRYRYNNVLV